MFEKCMSSVYMYLPAVSLALSVLFGITRPEEFTKTLGRRTPADRVQGTITLTITIIEPSTSPGELKE